MSGLSTVFYEITKFNEKEPLIMRNGRNYYTLFPDLKYFMQFVDLRFYEDEDDIIVTIGLKEKFFRKSNIEMTLESIGATKDEPASDHLCIQGHNEQLDKPFSFELVCDPYNAEKIIQFKKSGIDIGYWLPEVRKKEFLINPASEEFKDRIMKGEHFIALKAPILNELEIERECCTRYIHRFITTVWDDIDLDEIKEMEEELDEFSWAHYVNG